MNLTALQAFRHAIYECFDENFKMSEGCVLLNGSDMKGQVFMKIQPHDRSIFHIAPRSHWEQARDQEEYRAETLESEGFIHCSNIHQILAVAEAFFSQRNDLVLLRIQTSRLLAPLKDEEGTSEITPLKDEERTSETYPHVYGPINREAVTAAYDFLPDEHGRFSLPQEVLN